ncbi:synaptotagmin-15-like [Chrysoperla carnea]|uniref:synaptotagmin-15-like n=1 Tax=Chrysoperla carnea TaxID=189513 RepID=UPI001D08EB41|nr:synaptotagmin-15-like [Chrysoperla carnea]
MPIDVENNQDITTIIPSLASDSSQYMTSSLLDFTEQQKNERYLYEVVYPILAIGASIVLITLLSVTIILSRKRKKLTDDDSIPNILIYPNKGSSGPQFLTKEIRFSLPPIRSTSLGDIEQQITDENLDTNNGIQGHLVDDMCSLLPTQHYSAQRSNSFSGTYSLGTLDPTLYRNTPELEMFEWPEGHLGRVWFSLKYESFSEKLLVTVQKIKNLPSRTLGSVNSCDPYIKLHLIPDERRILQSQQKKKTCNPYFDETFVFQVSNKDMADHILKLSVIDGGRSKRHNPSIGHITFPLRNLLNNDINNTTTSTTTITKINTGHMSGNGRSGSIGGGNNTTIQQQQEPKIFMFDLEKEVQETISELGELLLSLVYNANSSRLTVTVIEGRKLKLKDESRDIYVRVTLNQQYKAVKVKRTRSVRPTLTITSSSCSLSSTVNAGNTGGSNSSCTNNTNNTLAAMSGSVGGGGGGSTLNVNSGMMTSGVGGGMNDSYYAVQFTEGFNFRVHPQQQDLTSISLHVFHTASGYGKEKLIGKCVLGSYMFARGKAQTQWNTAFATPMEQVQQWHTLSE